VRESTTLNEEVKSMNMMTTHRTIQIHNLLDTVSSKAHVCRMGSANLARIGNAIGSASQLHRAQRFERIAERCQRRLGSAETALQELRSAQVSWGNLADSEESLAKFYEDNGKPYGSTDTYHYRAQMYRRVVQALQIQIDTGVSVCSCCLKPFGSGQCTLGEAA
jgi:hypothetical protein